MARPALILTERDILEIDLTLVRLLKESEAKCALLVDQDGRMLARKGFTKNIDCEALAALLAGSFASNKAIAQLVGEPEFSIMFHQGNHDSIQNNLVDDDTILCVIFDERTTIGMVRVYAKEAAEKVARTLANARASNVADDEDYSDVQEEATAALDLLFGSDAPGGDDGATAMMPAGRPPKSAKKDEDTQPPFSPAELEAAEPDRKAKGDKKGRKGDKAPSRDDRATLKEAVAPGEDDTMADVFLQDLLEEAENAVGEDPLAETEPNVDSGRTDMNRTAEMDDKEKTKPPM